METNKENKVKKPTQEFIVQGHYGQGWEDLTSEDTHRAAREQLRCYNENETNYPHRVITRRIKKA